MRFTSRFERITPEEAGIRTEDLIELLSSYATGDVAEEVHAFALLHRGKLLAEGAFAPFRIEEKHEIFSGTKMLTGAAIGFAEAEGILREDERIADLFPDLLPASAQEELYELRISHLLTMSLGMEGQAVHTVHTLAEEDASVTAFSHLRAILARRFAHRPGEVFSYDNEASYLLSAIITRKTGLSLEEYLTPRLFAPLGMETPSFGKDKDGISYGYMGVRLTVEEYALLGEVYRCGGCYAGKQILPVGFCERAIAKRIDTPPMPGADWGEGYASHFWRGRHASFRFCGAYGQMCAVFPDKELVFAVFSGCDYFNIPHVLEKFYDVILSRMSAHPIEKDGEKEQTLRRFCKDLALPSLYSTPSPLLPLWENTDLTLSGTDLYDRVRISHRSDSLTLSLFHGDNEVKIAVGLRAPVRTVIPKERSRFPYPTERHDTVLSAQAYFPTVYELHVTLHFLHTPYAATLILNGEQKTARLTAKRF